ncbi:MAG: hypothetical protein LBD64_05245 [Odoribacteraceae bacterium]|jgi:hypothetical protein|nr:hypothetical protein [Odoribacteraceae bacterium]
MNRFLLLLQAIPFLLVACNEVDEPFKGTDNYITAFALRQGETLLDASITGDLITLVAPEGLSLNMATAIVKISENASIFPDPSAIDGWEEERLFVVTARDGKQKTYKYTVERQGKVHVGAIFLRTQADVDAFGTSGITFLEGNLTIGNASGADSITSLAPLADLKDVVYNLTLNPTIAVTALEGLGNLRSVGGTLQVGVLPRVDLFSLPSLQRAGSININNTTAVIIDLPALVEVSKTLYLNCPLYQLQLPLLERAGALTLTTTSTRSTSVIDEISLPALEQVREAINITYLPSLSKVRLPGLKTAGSISCSTLASATFFYLPSLEEVTGTLSFSSLASLPELELPALSRAGSLFIDCASLGALSFPRLERVNTLTARNLLVNDLDGFSSLQEVGDIIFYNLPLLDKIAFPPSLHRVNLLDIDYRATKATLASINVKGINMGMLYLRGEATRARIAGDERFPGTLKIYPYNASDIANITFPALEGITEIDSIYLTSMGMLDINIAGIRKVNKGLYMQSAASAPRTFSLPDIVEIGGSLTIAFTAMSASTTFTSLSLDKLERVGGDFSFTAHRGSLDTLACPALTTVGGNLNISTCYDYSTYRGLSVLDFRSLATIGGKMTIHSGNTSRNNTRLANLNGFAALASVKAIEISRQGALADYNGLKKAFAALPSLEGWTLSNNAYNPSVEDLQAGKWTKQ